VAVQEWIEQGTGTVRVNDEHRVAEFEEHKGPLERIARREDQYTIDRAIITRQVEEAFIAQLDLLRDLPGTSHSGRSSLAV
jgi:hypothetical protein